MIFVHRGKIDEDYVIRLTENLNAKPEGEILHHYLSSEGGEMGCAAAVIDIMNKYQDQIELIAFGQIYSAAFHIFFKYEGPRKILDSTDGIIHHRMTMVWMTSDGRIKKDADTILVSRTMKGDCDSDICFLEKLGLSEKQIKKFKNQGDVEFNCDELRLLHQNQINVKANKRAANGAKKAGVSSKAARRTV